MHNKRTPGPDKPDNKMADLCSFTSLLALVDSHLSKTSIQGQVEGTSHSLSDHIQIPRLAGHSGVQSDTTLSSPGQRINIPTFQFGKSPINDVLAEQVSNMLKAKELKRQQEVEQQWLVEETKRLKLEEDKCVIDLMQALQTPYKPDPKKEKLSNVSSLEDLFETNFIEECTEEVQMKTPEPLLPCTTDMSHMLRQKVKRGKTAAGQAHRSADKDKTDPQFNLQIQCHKIFASEKYFNIHYNKAHGGLLPVDEEDEMAEEPPTVEELMKPAEPEVEDQKHKAPEQVIYYKCDLCKILYPSEKAYNVHFNKKHGGQSCTEVQTPGFQLLEQELEECQNTSLPAPLSGETFFCNLCPKTFTMKRSLTVHLKRIHFQEVKMTTEQRNANRSKVCDVCGRAYNSNAALRYHQRRHTGEKPYPCTICPKRFTMPMFLQIHMRTHTGEKPYECPHCPKAFTNKAALIRHDRVHSGVKPYPCPECGKFFTQSNSMKLHVSTVHLKLPAPYKSRSRRSKSEARALQLALKSLPQEELVLGE